MKTQMIPTGFSDECAADLARQIDMHELLGWSWLELRMVQGVQVDDMDDGAFEAAASLLQQRGMGVSCIGSAMGKKTLARQSLKDDLAALDKLCRFAHRLGCSNIRIMAYEQGDLTPEAWRDRAAERLGELGHHAGRQGIRLLLENCVGYPSLSGQAMVEVLRLAGSKHIACAFDIGNAVYYGSDAWEYYQAVKPYIAYIHVKDTRWDRTQCFPGEGDARVVPILQDMARSGWQGFVSIEPHMASTEHLASSSTADRWEVYLRYGQMLNDILAAIAQGA